MATSTSKVSIEAHVQQAYNVCVPDMNKRFSTDEFSMMVLQALEAICIHQEDANDGTAAPEPSDSDCNYSAHGKIWLQIYADSATVDKKISSTDEAVNDAEHVPMAAPLAATLAE